MYLYFFVSNKPPLPAVADCPGSANLAKFSIRGKDTPSCTPAITCGLVLWRFPHLSL